MSDLEWSERIDQAIQEYPEVGEYLEAIRGNIEALAGRLKAVETLHASKSIVEVWGKSLTVADDFQVCEECTDPDNWWTAYPCRTVKAVRGE